MLEEEEEQRERQCIGGILTPEPTGEALWESLVERSPSPFHGLLHDEIVAARHPAAEDA